MRRFCDAIERLILVVDGFRRQGLVAAESRVPAGTGRRIHDFMPAGFVARPLQNHLATALRTVWAQTFRRIWRIGKWAEFDGVVGQGSHDRGELFAALVQLGLSTRIAPTSIAPPLGVAHG